MTRSQQHMSVHQWLSVGVSAAAIGFTLLACSAQEEPERVGAERASVLLLEPETTVESGAPSPRSNSCPGGKLPDSCGSWAGVELEASRVFPRWWKRAEGEDAHCLCQAIEFQIPSALPVTRGRAGWDWDKATLSFRKPSGKTVECRYRGNGNPLGGHLGIPLGGDKYVFERCSDGSKPGQTKSSDWFELEMGHGNPHAGPTEVQLRLGEADVVGGVVQEQTFYASDPRIAGAALHVPRGSAPAFESFSFELLTAVPLGTSIANAGDPVTTISRAVDVRAESSDTFSFSPVPGGACPRIELPYDQAKLEGLVGKGGAAVIQARQLTTLSGLNQGQQVLAEVGPVTVNLTQRTFSFCVEHLSYYLGAVSTFNASLVGASIASVDGFPPLPATNLLGNQLPVVVAGEEYEMSLTFANLGSATWTSGGTPRLLPVNIASSGTFTYPGSSPWTLTEVDRSAFGGTTFSPSPVAPSASASGSFNTATYTFRVTAPSTPQTLNLCLRNGSSNPFGACFTWDPANATNPGRTGAAVCVPQTEVCNGVDDDCDLEADEGVKNACGTCGDVPVEICDGQDNDCDGTPDDGVKNACGTCGDVPTETCNGLDDDCDGTPDDGVSKSCGGCEEPAILPGTACSNGQLGACHRDGQFVCIAGSPTTACNVGFVAPGSESCNGLDNDCNGTPNDLNECHTIIFHARNVDDEVVLDDGYPAIPQPGVGHVFPGSHCYAAGHGGIGTPFVPASLDCALSESSVVDAAGRAIFTATIINSGCLDTEGHLYVEIDGVDYQLSGQSRVIAHCGVTHQVTFAVDLRRGEVTELSARACINDGDCIR